MEKNMDNFGRMSLEWLAPLFNGATHPAAPALRLMDLSTTEIDDDPRSVTIMNQTSCHTYATVLFFDSPQRHNPGCVQGGVSATQQKAWQLKLSSLFSAPGG